MEIKENDSSFEAEKTGGISIEKEFDQIINDQAKIFWTSVKRLIVFIVNFITHVLDYFKRLFLHAERHKPFIANLSKIKAEFKDAPVKNCGIFEGVYDEVTDDIIHKLIIESDSLDTKTREILGNNKLVVLA